MALLAGLALGLYGDLNSVRQIGSEIAYRVPRLDDDLRFLAAGDTTVRRMYARYYYDVDRPGRILCQGAEEFGGLWLVVRGSGQPVR